MQTFGKSVGAGFLIKYFRFLMLNLLILLIESCAICVAEKVDVIIPLVTRELFAFASNKRLFIEEWDFCFCFRSLSTLNIANNKYLL